MVTWTKINSIFPFKPRLDLAGREEDGELEVGSEGGGEVGVGGLAPELGGVVSLGCREAVDVDRLVLVVSHVGCVDLSKTIK